MDCWRCSFLYLRLFFMDLNNQGIRIVHLLVLFSCCSSFFLENGVVIKHSYLPGDVLKRLGAGSMPRTSDHRGIVTCSIEVTQARPLVLCILLHWSIKVDIFSVLVTTSVSQIILVINSFIFLTLFFICIFLLMLIVIIVNRYLESVHHWGIVLYALCT